MFANKVMRNTTAMMMKMGDASPTMVITAGLIMPKSGSIWSNGRNSSADAEAAEQVDGRWPGHPR